MDLATARVILENPERARHQSDFVLAGQILEEHWRRNPNQLKPVRLDGVMTTDAPKRRRETLEDVVASLRAINKRLRDGDWQIQHAYGSGAAQTGRPLPSTSPLLAALPPLRTGESMMGDATQRYHALNAARANNAKFGKEFNAAANKHWRPAA